MADLLVLINECKEFIDFNSAYTCWPTFTSFCRANKIAVLYRVAQRWIATTLIVNFMNIVDETEFSFLFYLRLGKVSRL